jgi:gliding motility-associated-like protein
LRIPIHICRFPKFQYLMVRRLFTHLVFVLGLLSFTVLQAQQVKFALTPSTVTAAVGDTVNLDVVVTNFTNISSLALQLEWDLALFDTIKAPMVDKVTLPNSAGFGFAPDISGNLLRILWVPGGAVGTVPNGQAIFRLRLKVKAVSSNLWVRFLTGSELEVIQNNNPISVIPAFGNVGIPPGTTYSPLVVKTSSHSIPTSQSFCVGVTANNFANIESTKWQMKWDSSLLQYESLTKFNTTLGLNTANFVTTQALVNGRLNFSWNSTPAKTVPDGDTLYKVCFKAIGASSTSTPVQTLTAGAEIFRASGSSSTLLPLSPQNSTVSISGGTTPPTGGLTFSATNESGNVGDTVCVRVYAKNFTNVGSINWSMHFDSTKFSFVKARIRNAQLGTDSLVLPDPATANFYSSPNNIFVYRLLSPPITGTIRFFDQLDAAGVTFTADSTLIYDVCLKVIAGAGTTSNFTFDGIPLKTLILDPFAVPLTASFVNGKINIGNTATPAIVATGDITPVNCFGGSTGAIVQTVSGGTGTFTYSWTGPSGFTAATKDITARTAGAYTVTITSGTAPAKVNNYTITEPTAALASSKVPTPVNCFGQATGGIVLTVAGGTAPYTYIWSSSEITKDISSKAAGTYTVTITDAKSCTKTETADITQPTAAVSALNTITPVKCNGGNDGAIALTVSGGTGPYTYAWTSTGFTAATKDIGALAAGSYSCTITDSKNCALTLGPISVTQPAILAITPSVTNTACSGNTGAISIATTGGTTPLIYSWTGPNGYTSTNQNITGLETGSYTIEITDNNGCKKSSTSTVGINNRNFGVTFDASNITCNGGNDGSIVLTVTGGTGVFTYAWSGPNFTSTSKDIVNLKAGGYNLSVTETSTGCKAMPNTITITEPTAITIATPVVTDIRCKGDATGDITLTVAGGTIPYTYAWSGPNGFTAFNTRAISTLKAGLYNVTVTDSKNCTKISSIEVKEPTGNVLSLATPSVTNIKCNGVPTGAIAISVTGGVLPYTYVWSGPNGFTSTQQNLANVLAGTYKVTISDANGCKVISNDLIILQPAALDVSGTAVNAVAACNGKITLAVFSGTLPYTYSWTGKDVASTSKDQINLCPNETYTVTVTDGGNCTVTKSFTITGTIAPPIDSVVTTVISQAGCPGQGNGAINMTFKGGKAPFSIEWLNTNSLVIGRTQDITGLAAGKYRVRITDAVGQVNTSTEIDIKESASTLNISITSMKPQSCSATDGELRIDVTGGVLPYSYKWNSGPSSKDLIGVVEGKYSVTVTDKNQCLSDKKDMVVDRTLCPLSANSFGKTVNCFGEKASVTVSIQNGEPGYVVRWSPTDSIRINNTPRRDGTYDITNLAAGSYTITVTDAKGQSTTNSVTVTQPEEIKVIKSVSADSGNCSGSIVLSVTGGFPPYTYVWNDGARSRDRFNICNGQILSVVVSDSKNCFTSTKNDTIRSGIKALVLSTVANITNTACPNDATGRIDITVEGGVKPYKYTWSNGSTLEDPIDLKSGTYSVTVSDNTTLAQKAFGTFVVTSSSTLKIKDLVTTTSAATVTIEGGEAPYKIEWCNGASQNTSNTTSSQSNLASGVCGVTVTDNKGCKISRAFDITASCAVVVPSAILSGGYNLPCSDSKGSASVQTVTDQVLTPPYSYRWDTNESGPTATQLPAGARTVTVVGNNGKTCIASFIMRAPTELKVSVISTSENCALEANVTGGVAPYKYKWSTPKMDTTVKVKDLDNNKSYFVIVTDANNCGTAPGVGTAQCSSFCLKGGAVLTPNDDAKNDKFDIQKCDFKNIRLQVYNRWGQLVYLNEDYNDQWEGNNQDGKGGKALPEGVYMYVLRGIEPNGKETSNTGTVTILR